MLQVKISLNAHACISTHLPKKKRLSHWLRQPLYDYTERYGLVLSSALGGSRSGAGAFVALFHLGSGAGFACVFCTSRVACATAFLAAGRLGALCESRSREKKTEAEREDADFFHVMCVFIDLLKRKVNAILMKDLRKEFR